MKCKAIALCGTIGSGKSTVGSYLTSKGFVVFDTDKIAKEISKEPAVLLEVEALLGKDFLQNGQLDRKKIRQFVFSNPDVLKKYNAIFFERVKAKLTEALNNLSGIVFVEIPLLHAFSFNWYEIWKIESQKQLQLKWVALRDGVEKSHVESIFRSQSNPETQTHIIKNISDINSLFCQVDKLLKRLI